jgi:coiled-coil domain-containing protein 130
MPFAVWCTTCKPHETLIGQGVRFNAEKKKIGNYFSTPVYSFRMRHTQCGGWIEIRTDPKNTAYVVVEGGRKRDTGEDKEMQMPGEIAVRGDGARGEGEKRDPFARLEGKVEDKRVFDTERSRILELQGRQMRDWEDPYEKSRRLRRRFRSERKGLEAAEARREALRDKLSLGIELVDETEEDRARAEMVDFHADADGGPARAARVRPLFQSSASSPVGSGGNSGSKHGRRSKATDQLARRKETFRNELAGNTRAAVDPFLNDGSAWQPGIKRRRTANKPTAERDNGLNQAEGKQPNIEDASLPVDNTPAQAPAALVAYASDSE